MEIVLLHNHYCEQKLEEVKKEMTELGAPTVMAYDLGFDGLYQAIEGSHRLRAAHELGLTPNIFLVDADTQISELNLDVDYLDGDTVQTLGDIDNVKICF